MRFQQARSSGAFVRPALDFCPVLPSAGPVSCVKDRPTQLRRRPPPVTARTSRMSPKGLLFITLFNSILGLSVLFPILAPLGRELGLSELQVGSLSASYALMQFLVSPAWGRLSERVGRKRVLMTGVLGFGVSFTCFALIADFGGRAHWPVPVLFGALLLTRLIGGAFSSATLPTAQAYMADMTGRRDRTAGMAVIGAAFGLGVIFGPAIGAAFSLVSLLAAVY